MHGREKGALTIQKIWAAAAPLNGHMDHARKRDGTWFRYLADCCERNLDPLFIRYRGGEPGVWRPIAE